MNDSKIIGLGFDGRTRKLLIDIVKIGQCRHIKDYEYIVLNELNRIKSHISTIHINVGENYNISMLEKDMSLIKQLAIFFYSSPIEIVSCHIYNMPSTFSSIFSIIKPLLTKSALRIIHFEEKKRDKKDVNLLDDSCTFLY